ncbi:MAG TPA: tRNA (N(6)-L-threonylcarbamoyladenosine(37)-C(2))-methylthiotransferase MtaB [Rectinemataceae bacterium]|nr:tRNA (N(6)-L-threonylcarbamoyladenosine(37)-C(2))-methylthiotransferase MtaB [Rectinemataceae bacterium]
MKLSVAFNTLGCKLNQLESESLADSFMRSGAMVRRGGDLGLADIVIVNTCTVTGKAEQKARRLIRQALSRNPTAVAIVTGCYAQVEAESIAGLHERAVVVPGEEKAGLLGLAEWLAEEWQGHGDLLDAVLAWRRASGGGSADPFAFRPEEFAFHSRPSLKIEDGCDNLCAYCRVRIARGRARSLAADEVLGRLQALEAAGKAEVVLTGVNLFHYRDGEGRFPDLLRFLLEGTERIALRLSSYEPEGINEDFLDAFSHPRLRPHIHLPVQSGSDRLLGLMARAYRREKVLAACEALRKAKGDLFIGADIITGFPGEGEKDFADTLDLAKRCDFAWIHAFPFSPRPGTAAWDMLPKVPQRVAGERVALLEGLAREGRKAFVARQAGLGFAAVLEGDSRVGSDGLGHATSANYLKILVEGLPPGLSGGEAIRCRLDGRRAESSSLASPVGQAGDRAPPLSRPSIMSIMNEESEKLEEEGLGAGFDTKATFESMIE